MAEDALADSQQQRHHTRVLFYEDWSGDHLLAKWSDSLGEISIHHCSRTRQGAQICNPITPYGYKIANLEKHNSLLIKALKGVESDLNEQHRSWLKTLSRHSQRRDLKTLSQLTEALSQEGALEWLIKQFERPDGSLAFSRPSTLEKVKVAMQVAFTQELPPQDPHMEPDYDYGRDSIEMAAGF